jgi:hypothetical protein
MMWNIDPWEAPTMLMVVGQIVSWCIVLYGMGRAMNWLASKISDGADVTRGMRDTTDQWLRVRPPQKVRRRLWWKYAGLWFNNMPGSLLAGYAVATGRWWVLIGTAAMWYWAGQEFGRQVALDQTQRWEDNHADKL